ncbi:hypothetical protein B0H21DRAFT_788904 [Amylocystis lapponica]|nr:hypothetical protein B0H21DRAFT_788904 [Amylocystis lapponica]
MNTIPAPTIVLPKEEWPDADFDFPDGDSIHASEADSDKEDDGDDWDTQMGLGQTGGARAQLVLDGIAARLDPSRQQSNLYTIRPPLPTPPTDDEDDDEGVSTIKVAALPKVPFKPSPSSIDEDFEDGFALPSDLTQLSLRPLSLLHRSSKTSLEWGDKDQTSSSQSSDAYSTFGFADNSPSSNYTSASLPETETDEDDDDDGDLDGLVIPSGLFESGQSGKKLAKILETKKKTAFSDERIKVASPDPEDDFEIGLVIDNDVEFSPSRLLLNAQGSRRAIPVMRSKSVPPRQPAAARPPSRLKTDRAKSPSNPPVSSATQLRKLGAPPSPPNRPSGSVRSHTYSQALGPGPSSPMSFLAPKPGSLRVQKSHSGLKPASPPSTRRLGRKASLPSLSESSQTQASGSGSASGSSSGSSQAPGRYNAPTASSRAKSHTNSASRITMLEYNVPPTRPSTPSSNPAALRLTMPTSSSRMKLRTPISSVFPSPARSASPLPPPRPPSASSLKARPGHSQTQSAPVANAPKVLRRPKRQRTYGDGTELDAFDDLPLNREKEGQYRVQPKTPVNRVPGASYPKAPATSAEALGKGTLRRKGKRELSGSSVELAKAGPSKTLKRTTGRIEFPAKTSEPMKTPESARTSDAEVTVKKKKLVSSPSSVYTRRKPTLIRNLGGSGAPKTVGEMKWNPNLLRWEGNDQALRDFDTANSTRPALITHLTGSSIGSPVGSFAAGARVVGNMIFDPSRMCWISTLSPDEDEPDVFADLADDEDEDDWEARGGTIRASQQLAGATTAPPSSAASDSRVEPPSPAHSHPRTRSDSESDRGSRASMVCDVDDAFVEKCRAAAERHRVELKGWLLPPPRAQSFAEPDRSYLFEIRALATRQY